MAPNQNGLFHIQINARLVIPISSLEYMLGTVEIVTRLSVLVARERTGIIACAKNVGGREMKPEKDEFMLGVQQELNKLGIKNVYKRMLRYDYKKKIEHYVHQIMVNGLICRAMYITFLPATNSESPELHVSDRMYYEYSNKDWHMVLADPKSNPQLVVDLFRDLKAVGDKYGQQPKVV
jgi:hypothetical protein